MTNVWCLFRLDILYSPRLLKLAFVKDKLIERECLPAYTYSPSRRLGIQYSYIRTLEGHQTPFVVQSIQFSGGPVLKAQSYFGNPSSY